MANKAICGITTSILPDDIKASLQGRYSFNPLDGSYKWVYTTADITSTSGVLLTTSHSFVGSTTALSNSDKILWMAIKHSGTTNGSSTTNEGIVISLDAATVTYDLADGIYIGSKELFTGKFPNTTINNLTGITCGVVNNVPSGAGSGNVRVQIAAIINDV
mgnify:CR=1 FL=1|tara:strand:+ start:1653 stop:2135 length:483 start_codon:yes stop_codon:yes gene_type:complete